MWCELYYIACFFHIENDAKYIKFMFFFVFDMKREATFLMQIYEFFTIQILSENMKSFAWLLWECRANKIYINNCIPFGNSCFPPSVHWSRILSTKKVKFQPTNTFSLYKFSHFPRFSSFRIQNLIDLSTWGREFHIRYFRYHVGIWTSCVGKFSFIMPYTILIVYFVLLNKTILLWKLRTCFSIYILRSTMSGKQANQFN